MKAKRPYVRREGRTVDTAGSWRKCPVCNPPKRKAQSTGTERDK